MKKLIPLFSLLLIFSFGCEDDKAETEQVDPLVGVYNMTSASVSILSNPVQTLTFNHNGSTNYLVFILGDDGVYSFQGKLDGDAMSEGGTWSSTGNKLTLISGGGSEISDFTLSGNNLVLTMSEPETAESYGITITYNFTKE